MDIERLRKLQEALAVTETYDQNMWFDDDDEGKVVSCRTPACVAGHAIVLFSPEGTVANDYPEDMAQELLGLDHRQARNLFDADPYGGYDEVEQDEAIKAIESLIRYGQVIWPARDYDDEDDYEEEE